MKYEIKMILQKLKEKSYFLALSLMLVALPLSKALVSISLVLLLLSWFLTFDYREKLSIIKKRKSILVFLIGYILVAFGLLYSENFQRNIFLLFNIKISLVLLPLVIGTSRELTEKESLILLVLFSCANLIAVIVSSLILFQIVPYEFTDIREISVFIESIRFALLLVINILMLLYLFFVVKEWKWKIIVVALITIFIIYLNLLQALTGLLALFSTLAVVALVYWKRIHILLKTTMLLIVIFVISAVSFTYIDASKLYYAPLDKMPDIPDSTTVNGNPYYHNLNDSSAINGHFVNVFICEPELRKEWEKVSSKSLDSLDLRKWSILYSTLVSYMSSKGLKKDSVGFSKLSKRDIRLIEYGYTNAALAGIGMKARVYDLIREFDVWKKTGLPAGSVTIRINAMVNGWKVFKKNIWFGTGYGDINDEIQKQFEADNLVFGDDKRQNPHNQFFTILIGSGITGFIIFTLSLVLPGFMERKYKSYLFLVSFCVVVFSFLSDDTLERMIGCIITAFFFSLFLYAVPSKDMEPKI